MLRLLQYVPVVAVWAFLWIYNGWSPVEKTEFWAVIGF